MASRISRYLAFQDALSDGVGKLVSWISLVLIIVLLYEVVMRYWLNSPTVWGHELSTMLFGAFGVLTGAYTLRHRAHVRSEVVYALMPRRLQHLCDAIINVLILVAFIIFFSMSLEFALASWQMNEISGRSTWEPVLYPIKSTIPLAVGLLILQTVAELVRSVLLLFNIPFHDPRHDASA
ncbi:MAG: TRAP transporter small permease subunit [Castellaniella sp.]